MRAGSEVAGWIREHQRRWAQRGRLAVDSDGFAEDVDSHLLCPLSAETRAELGASAHGWLGEPGKRAPLQALHSPGALLCNFFEPWRGGDLAPLARAFGVTAAHSLSFSRAVDGVSETARPLEADAWLDGPRPVAVFASFSEVYSAPDRTPARGALDDPRPVPDLPGCRGLARDVSANPSRFGVVEAGRILERAAALTRQLGPRAFRMIHLWYDAPAAPARQQARELDRLRMRIGGEIDFAPISWQTLFARLCGEPAWDAHVAGELVARYFPD